MDSSIRFSDFVLGVISVGVFFIGGTALLDGVVRPYLQDQVGGSGYTQLSE